MNTKTETKTFPDAEGSIAEYHVMITVTDPSLGFQEQLDSVIEACKSVSEHRTVHFQRFFLSDASNQAPKLLRALKAVPASAVSIVQQPPLDRTRIAAWMYCTSPMTVSDGAIVHNGYSHLWAGSLTAPGEGSLEQMSGIFRDFGDSLACRGLAVASDTVRTWIFVRDVDVNYHGAVVARREYFERIGLTPETHFIASTGIEGRHPDFSRLVAMDTYSIGGLREGQMGYLFARDHLSPTSDYGVTFERGAYVTYGDRRHVFISGTASIDSKGRIVHEGDVRRQAERMMENISALLREAGASLDDLMYGIVYLRDFADYHSVRSVVSGICPGLEPLYVLAPVCRPGWLVEMECMAIIPFSSTEYRDF